MSQVRELTARVRALQASWYFFISFMCVFRNLCFLCCVRELFSMRSQDVVPVPQLLSVVKPASVYIRWISWVKIYICAFKVAVKLYQFWFLFVFSKKKNYTNQCLSQTRCYKAYFCNFIIKSFFSFFLHNAAWENNVKSHS